VIASSSGLASRLAAIEGRITDACRRVGRERASVTLLGVSKQHPPETLLEAWEAGLRHFGENRVQEAAQKAAVLPRDIAWHMIGPLQTNKARSAVEVFQAVQTIDRLKVAEALDSELARQGRRLPCLLEVNLAGEDSKHGFEPAALLAALGSLAACKNLEIRGLMAIPPVVEDPEDARPWFMALRELGEQVAATDALPDYAHELSMGMSHDFEVAIEEGATCVRVGTALFGNRPARNAP
jgi:PLP dependent protein